MAAAASRAIDACIYGSISNCVRYRLAATVILFQHKWMDEWYLFFSCCPLTAAGQPFARSCSTGTKNSYTARHKHTDAHGHTSHYIPPVNCSIYRYPHKVWYNVQQLLTYDSPLLFFFFQPERYNIRVVLCIYCLLCCWLAFFFLIFLSFWFVSFICSLVVVPSPATGGLRPPRGRTTK